MSELLFAPVKVGARTLKNRLIMPAVVTNLALANRISPRMIDHYRARAQGGVGAIVLESVAVAPSTVTQDGNIIGFDATNEEGFKRLADAVESEDCRLFGQVMHLGRHHVAAPGLVSVSATSRHDPASWASPHKLTLPEIRAMIEAFVSAAARLHGAGFSGVELHGAQGFLILQFLSPVNDRDDGYGGDLEGRTRFAREIAAAVRATCGRDFLIAFKMPADEGLGPVNGLDADGAVAVVTRLARDGVIDLFSFGMGGPGPTFDQHVPDMTFAPAPFADRLAPLKAAAGAAAVVGLGRVTDAAHAEAMLASGACDLIGMARPLIADPAWPNKIRAGESADIRPCIYCNACWAQLPKSRPLACVVNPRLDTGDEALPSGRAAAPKRVVVIGAGPAGLEAAWSVARRGHQVALYEAREELGGLAAWQAALPGRGETARLIRFQEAQARAAGAAIHLGAALDAEAALALDADVFIIAAGSRFTRPAAFAPGAPAIDIVTATRELLAAPGRRDGHVVLYDQTQTEALYAAADLLAASYDAVTILSPRGGIATEAALISLPGVLRRLGQGGVDFEIYVGPSRMEGDALIWRSVVSGREKRIEGVTKLVYAAPRIAEDGLASALGADGRRRVLLAGDARAPRSLMTAVHDGAAAAAALESEEERAA